MNKEKVRVRFAPSPTGWLHVGGARTALINYLFAKNQQGKFILRVEDTDIERGKNEFLKSQLQDLKWLGLNWDEGPNPDTLKEEGPYGPYRQSQRLYQKYADELLKTGKAYYCFLTAKDIDKMKEEAQSNKKPLRVKSPYRNMSLKEAQEKKKEGTTSVIRFKVPEIKKNYVFQDIVRGEISFPSDMVGDFVLLRSSGLPVYNFSCAVDDYSMKISHVFRSEEHLANTLRQLMLFEAFNWPLPEFGHLSIILGEDRKKLSKRHGAVSCGEYKKQGYLPEALLNLLALMGWNPKTKQEFFSLSELVNNFSIKGLNPSPGVFDVKKLNWINVKHLKQMPAEDFWIKLQPYLKEEKFPSSPEWRNKAIKVIKNSLSSLSEAVELFRFLSETHFKVDDTAKEILEWPTTSRILKEWQLFLEKTQSEEINSEMFSKACKDIQTKMEVKGKKLFMPIRVAVLGCSQGMELKLVIPLITRSVLLKRVNQLL